MDSKAPINKKLFHDLAELYLQASGTPGVNPYRFIDLENALMILSAMPMEFKKWPLRKFSLEQHHRLVATMVALLFVTKMTGKVERELLRQLGELAGELNKDPCLLADKENLKAIAGWIEVVLGASQEISEALDNYEQELAERAHHSPQQRHLSLVK